MKLLLLFVTLIGFALPNILLATAMCAVYALRFSQPTIIFAAVPLIVTVAIARRLFSGRDEPRTERCAGREGYRPACGKQ